MKGALHASPLGSRIRVGVDKVRWGVRAVGWPATALGAARLVRLKLTRPSTVTVRLRQSGAILTFAYPLQLVPALVVFGDLIDPEYPFLAAVAKPDWVFLDVGAAIGQFSVFAASFLGGRVHAFEPSAENLEALRRNITQNGIEDRVTVHRLALSDRRFEATLATDSNPFMSRLDVSRPGAGELVPVDTLTNAIGTLGIDHVAVLKINVAGFEPAVLAGARPFLARGGADVLILLIGRQSYEAYRDLAGMGYRFFFFHPLERRLHEVPSLDDDGLVRNRPWPARHVLALRTEAISRVVGGGAIAIASPAPGGMRRSRLRRRDPGSSATSQSGRDTH